MLGHPNPGRNFIKPGPKVIVVRVEASLVFWIFIGEKDGSKPDPRGTGSNNQFGWVTEPEVLYSIGSTPDPQIQYHLEEFGNSDFLPFFFIT